MAARNIYIKYMHSYSIPPRGSESVGDHSNGDLALVSLWIFSIFSEIRSFNEEYACFNGNLQNLKQVLTCKNALNAQILKERRLICRNCVALSNRMHFLSL
eukprot:NODE_10_length_47437_cov_0.363429.p35 type:complete len:101 gc:universal NODE_10_length_47437_cov_0.363429:17049-16747(-)